MTLSAPRETSGATRLLFDGRPLGAVDSDDTRPYPNEDWYSRTKKESIKVVRPQDLGWGPVWNKVFRFRHRLSADAVGGNPGQTATNWVWNGNPNQGRSGLGTSDVGIANGVEQWLGRSLFFPEDFPPMAVRRGFANFRASKLVRAGGGGSSSIHWWLRNDTYELQVQGGPIDCRGQGYASQTATLFEKIPKGIWIDVKVDILFRTDDQGYFVAWVALRTDLTERISAEAATIPLRSTDGLPRSGSLVLGGSERITYTGKTASSVTGVTRGVQGAATEHSAGTTVTQATWNKVWDSRNARHSTLKSWDPSCGRLTWLGAHAIGVYRSWTGNVDDAPDITWGELGLLVSGNEGGIDGILGHAGDLREPSPEPEPDPEPRPDEDPDSPPDKPAPLPRGGDSPRITSFDFTSDEACATCRAWMSHGRLWSHIDAPDPGVRSAYGVHQLGAQWTGRIWTRTQAALAASSTLSTPLVLEEMRDADDEVVYQIVASPLDHAITLVSPPGGLDANSLRLDTGVALTNTPRRIEVSAEANKSVAVRVDGRLTNEVVALAGATSNGQHSLRAGIVDYAGSGVDPVAVVHGAVGASMAGWLNDRRESLRFRGRPRSLLRKRLVVRLRGIPQSRVNVVVRTRGGRWLGHDGAQLRERGYGRAVVRLRRWANQSRLRVRALAVYRGPEFQIVKRDSKRLALRERERRRLGRR